MKHIKSLMERRSEWIRLLLNSRNAIDEKKYREIILNLDNEIEEAKKVIDSERKNKVKK